MTTNHLDMISESDTAYTHATRLRLVVRDLERTLNTLKSWQSGPHATGDYERALGAIYHALAELKHETTQFVQREQEVRA